jgi:hypothetical protein
MACVPFANRLRSSPIPQALQGSVQQATVRFIFLDAIGHTL